jgi:hypothetical protein
VAIHGGSRFYVMSFDDGLNTVGHTYTLTATDVKRDDLADITYDGVGEGILATGDNPHFGHSPASTVNVLSTAPNVYMTVATGAGDTINLGMPTGNVSTKTLQYFQGPLLAVIGEYVTGAGTVVVDDSGDPNSHPQVTYQKYGQYYTVLNGLAGPASNPQPIYFEVGPTAALSFFGGSGTNSLTANIPGDFTQSWTVAGFASSSFNIPGNFSGSLFAQSLGTAAQPIDHVQIGGSMTAGAKLKVDYLSTLSVAGDLAGTVYGYGNSGSQSQPTINTITIGGNFTGNITAPIIGSINQLNPLSSIFSGHAFETAPGLDFRSLVLGTLTSTAVIEAGSIVSASVAGDMGGQIIVSGPLGNLSVAGDLSGTVSATTIGGVSVGRNVTGRVSASQSLGSVKAGGTISGSVSAPTIRRAALSGAAAANDAFAPTSPGVVLNRKEVFSGMFGAAAVRRGSSNDLIVGNANPSALTGGTGRNVLIGGAGQATLDASHATSDNILIGGRTDWDMNLAALEAIMTEWDRPDLGFADRRSDVLNGTNGQGTTPLNVVNGQLILLTPSTNPSSSNGTVHANALADTLIGSTATDPATGKRVHNWFLYALDDVIENYVSSSDKKNHMT